MRQIFLASEEAQKRPALLRRLIANRAAQHGIAGFECIEHRAQCDRWLDFDRGLAAKLGQASQMKRQDNADGVQNHFFVGLGLRVPAYS